jgi:hypothetical protein
MKADSQEGEPFQQFFFRVADDTGLAVDDYFIDFHVLKQDNTVLTGRARLLGRQ